MGIRSHFIHILVLAALVLAGISPACEFISGKADLFEICGADGSSKQAEIDPDLALFLAAGQEQSPADEHHDKPGDDCAFCFAQTHLKTFKTAGFAHAAPAVSMTAAPAHDQRATGVRYLISHPRGPPAIS